MQKFFGTGKPKPKPKSIGGNVMEQLVGIGKSTAHGVAEVPGDLGRSAAESMGVRVGSSEHSRQVSQYLYGESGRLLPEELAQKQRDEQEHVPDELEKWRAEVRKYRRHTSRHELFTKPSSQQPSLQQQHEQEQRQQQQARAKQEQEQARKQPVALPSGVSKKPGLFGAKQIKKRQKGVETRSAYKGG